MQDQTQIAPTQQTRPRTFLAAPVLLACAFAWELFCSALLPAASTRQYGWEGIFWHPTSGEACLYALTNMTIALAAARLLTSDLAGRLSLQARRGAMLVALCAAGLLGAQAFQIWLIYSNEGSGSWGGPSTPGMMGHTIVVFHGAVAIAILRWISSRNIAQNQKREATRARMASMALLAALGARALTFAPGTTPSAIGLVLGLTAMLYAVYQLALLRRPTDLLLDDQIEVETAPRL